MAARFVGRTAELGELARRFDAALAGEASVVLVAGEPGIGKTGLVAELGRLAGAHGTPVLWGRCTDDDGAPAYRPWRQVLRAWRAADPDGPAAADPDDLAALAPLLGSAGGDSAGAGAEARLVLFDAAARVLTAAAARTGLLVALDDLQWADPDSLALLVHLAREAPTARLLVVGTARPAELAADPERAGHVARLAARPTAARIDLGGLTDADVGGALTERLGVAPPPETVAEVRVRSGGNPFFVGELARMLADGRAGPVPAAVRDVVRLRLGRLPAGCRALLDLAAVAGGELDEPLLGAVVGGPVTDALRPALDDGVLVRPPGRTAPRFAHDIVREALLEVLGDTERARLHARLAEVLEPRADDPDVLPELARHALAALPSGDPEAALDRGRAAAALAGERLAFAESARRWARVLEAGRPFLTPVQRARDLIELARAQLRAHAVSDAVASCVAAVDLARHAGDAATLAEAALVVQGISDAEVLTAQRDWCEEALAALEPGDTPVRARLLAQLAHTLLFVGRPDQVDACSTRALEIAERVGEPAALAAALRARQLAASGPEGNAERLHLGDRMLAVGGSDAVLWGHLWRFDALLQAGRIADAERELDELAPVAARSGQPLARLHVLRSRAALAFGRGAFDEVRALNDEAAALAVRGRHVGAAMTAQAVEWQVALLIGRDGLDGSLPAELAVHRESPVFAVMSTTMARWHLALCRPEEAARWYRDLAPPGSPRIPRFMSLIVEALRVQIALELGDTAPLEACYRFLAPYANLFVAGGAGATATHGSVHQYLGIAAAGLGRGAVAIRHLTASVEADEARGLAPFAATARHRLAVELRRRGRPGDAEAARAHADRAAATAARLGMEPLRRKITELDDALRDGGVLSPRETEIAGLVADGLSNRDIAAAVHISERTVESHVAHILAKLGFSRRTQIAAWVVARSH